MSDSDDKRVTDCNKVAAARRALADANKLCPIEVCHWCESPIKAGRVFCSTTCSEHWRDEQERRKALGL